MSSGIRLAWKNQSRRFAASGLVFPFSGALHPGISTFRRLTGRSSSTSNSPVPPLSTDVEPTTYSQAELVETKHARNTRFRDAFRARNPPTEEEIKNTASSAAYVPPARTYPSHTATKRSMAKAQEGAKVQLALSDIWAHFQTNVPGWRETFDLLKKMTPRRNEVPSMAAVRIVLPTSWDLTMDNMKLEFVDSATGLAAKLRASADQRNPHAIVLRGKSAVLAKAADELIAACKDVEIFQLGELAALDYEAKRLWPAIEDAPDGGSTMPVDKLDSIWIHREITTHWIETPYEQTPKPVEWTKDSFEAYVLAVVCGRLRPDLAMLLYGEGRKDGKLVDTDGIRVRLLLQAFEDPAARASITPSILKTAVAFMAHRGGHRSAANQLFSLAEEWGVPMDADLFNVMLDGYVSKRDVTFFHKFLVKMEKRYFHPNARTWLLFLKLLQKDGERRQVIVAMYELGLFEDPATRRGIAEVMASHDAYVAFKAGKTLETFLADQAARYGEGWLTTTSLNHMLEEYLPFYRDNRERFEEFKVLVERRLEDERNLDMSTIHVVLKFCAQDKDWNTALWALSLLPRHGLEPSHEVYKHVITLAFQARSPSSLGVSLFYAIVERKLSGNERRLVRRMLLGQVPHTFWETHKARLLSSHMASLLEKNKATHPNSVLASVEKVVLTACEGHLPTKSLGESLKVAFRTMDRPMHQQIKDPRRKAEDVQVGTMAVKMRDQTGGKKVIMLARPFVPETMLQRWRGKGEQDGSVGERGDGSVESGDVSCEQTASRPVGDEDFADIHDTVPPSASTKSRFSDAATNKTRGRRPTSISRNSRFAT